MKYSKIKFLFFFSVIAWSSLSAQNVLVEMTPYDTLFDSTRLVKVIDDLPEGWNCKIQDCPTKYMNSTKNIFCLSRKKSPTIQIKIAKKILNRLENNNKMFVIKDRNSYYIYNEKGLIKKIN